MDESYWEDLPKDIVWIILNKLHTPKDVLAFCGDPYLNKRFCRDENGIFWEYLYHRDLSEEIKLNEGETIKQKYLYWFDKFLSDIENAEIIKFDFGTKSNLLDSELNIQDVAYKIMRKAVKYGFEKIVEKIGLNSFSEDWIWGLAYYSVSFGKLNILRYLLKNSPEFITKPQEYGSTNMDSLIGNAAKSEHYNIIKYLIDEIAPLYNITPDLERALISAIGAKNGLPIVNMLLEKGVNIDNAIIIARSLRLDKEAIKLEKLKSKLSSKNEQITCLGQTKPGSKCCRITKSGSQYCWQHEK